MKGDRTLYWLRVLRLMSRMIFSDDDAGPAGFCLISTPQVRMNMNTTLDQNYICSIAADGAQSERSERIRTRSGLPGLRDAPVR